MDERVNVFHRIQSLQENRHIVEKVVYSVLYGLVNFSLPKGACRCCDWWRERRSVALYGRNVVIWKPISESYWPREVFVRTKTINTPIHWYAATFRTILYLVPRFGQQVLHRTWSMHHLRGRYRSCTGDKDTRTSEMRHRSEPFMYSNVGCVMFNIRSHGVRRSYLRRRPDKG